MRCVLIDGGTASSPFLPDATLLDLPRVDSQSYWATPTWVHRWRFDSQSLRSHRNRRALQHGVPHPSARVQNLPIRMATRMAFLSECRNGEHPDQSDETLL